MNWKWVTRNYLDCWQRVHNWTQKSFQTKARYSLITDTWRVNGERSWSCGGEDSDWELVLSCKILISVGVNPCKLLLIIITIKLLLLQLKLTEIQKLKFENRNKLHFFITSIWIHPRISFHWLLIPGWPIYCSNFIWPRNPYGQFLNDNWPVLHVLYNFSLSQPANPFWPFHRAFVWNDYFAVAVAH